MRRLEKKEALVYREYKNNLDAAMCHILGKKISVKELAYADIKLTKKEVVKILENLISEGFLYKDLTVISILSKKGELIRLLDDPTEEEQLVALENHIPNTCRNIQSLTDKAKRYILIQRGGEWGEYEWIKDFPDEELKLLLDENPDIATLLPEDRWTQYLVTEYLRKMVTSDRRELIDDYQHRVKIPERFRDKTFYRSFCMVDGYNYSKIPADKREEYISEKLINYTLDNKKSYVGTVWMYQYLPEKFKTEEISLKCCVGHPRSFSYLPESLKTYDFLMKYINMGQKTFPWSMCNLLSEDEIVDLIGKTSGYRCPDIDKKLITEKIAFALSRYTNAPEIIPKNFRTKEWYLSYVGHTGYLREVPKEFVDEEMCIAAIRGNFLAARKDVPEKFETQRFLETEAKELRFNSLKTVGIPHTAELLNQYAYDRPYNLQEIPEEERYLVTDDTLVSIIRDQERHWDSVLKFRENDMIIKALLEMTDPNREGEIKNRFYVVSQFSKVPEEVIEEFLPKQADAIKLKGITREQMERSVDYFPENVLYLPEEVAAEAKKDPTAIAEVKLDPFEKITVNTKYDQMTIWDIIGA